MVCTIVATAQVKAPATCYIAQPTTLPDRLSTQKHMDSDTDTLQRDAGLRAFSKNDFENAFTLLLPSAEAGDARAQMLLARMCYAGNGTEQSHEKYLYWLELAAANGEKSARARLKRARRK